MADQDLEDRDDASFTRRLQAEVVAEAERRRRRDPELQRLERDIERAWSHLAPPGATGPTEELLLDRVERLAMIDVDAPLGERRGVRQVKGAIRKGTYWYLRYVSDQLNALHNVQGRLLRRIDERLARLEEAAGLHRDLDRLLDPTPPLSSAVAAAVADVLVEGPVVVCVDPSGSVVDAVEHREAGGVAVYGVADDPDAVLAAVERGSDIRVGDPLDVLQRLEEGSLGGLVLAGFVERRGLPDLVRVAEFVAAALRPNGVVVVAVEDPASRTGAEAELLSGRGLGADGWARVLSRVVGADVVIVPVDDARVARLVVARRSQ